MGNAIGKPRGREGWGGEAHDAQSLELGPARRPIPAGALHDGDMEGRAWIQVLSRTRSDIPGRPILLSCSRNGALTGGFPSQGGFVHLSSVTAQGAIGGIIGSWRRGETAAPVRVHLRNTLEAFHGDAMGFP